MDRISCILGVCPENIALQLLCATSAICARAPVTNHHEPMKYPTT